MAHHIGCWFIASMLLTLHAVSAVPKADVPHIERPAQSGVESASPQSHLPEHKTNPAVLDSDRSLLPLYKTIPMAPLSELTPAARTDETHRSWARSNADSANSRYSSLQQITRENVSRLQHVWTYRSGGADSNNIQANPVIVDGVLYAPAIGNIVVALDAQTGAELWRFKPPLTERFPDDYGPAHRGLIFWHGNKNHPPRLYFTAHGYLYALDSKTGRPVDSFGAQGKAPAKGPVAPVIHGDTIVVSDLAAIQAFDLVTGRKLWRFDIVVDAAARGLGDLVINGVGYRYPGGSNWGGMALDEGRGLVIFSTGAPHPNFVGIDRPGSNEHTNSVVALDVRDGKLVWAFQDIAHDLWDLDIPAAPNLVTVMHRGKRVDAVAQVTKQGQTLLLDRMSGKPLFPYRMRRAPISQLPGERTALYQPDLELPEPFSRQEFTREDITDLTPAAREFVSKQLQDAVFGWFEPPRVDRPIVYYGVHGGAEWTGAAFDPTSSVLYVSANELPWLAWVSKVETHPEDARKEPTPGQQIFRARCAACHGENREGKGVAPALLGVKQALTDAQVKDILTNGRNAMPPMPMSEHEVKPLLDFLFNRERQADGRSKAAAKVTYADGGLKRLLDDAGYPGTKPPWGTLNAIELGSGKLLWKVPLGEYDELTRLGIPKTGTENFGGAMVTAGGLVFCAGTRDLKIRAFDKFDGRELWSYKLPFGGYAPPATYEVNGKQYIVIAASGGGKLGGERGDAYVAFALGERGKAN